MDQLLPSWQSPPEANPATLTLKAGLGSSPPTPTSQPQQGRHREPTFSEKAVLCVFFFNVFYRHSVISFIIYG